MSNASEVPLILGRPDYDLPLGKPAVRSNGVVVTGRDSLLYLWRFEGDRASLWAFTDGAARDALGGIRLDRPTSGEVGARMIALRDAQTRMRAVQTAYVQLAETLLAMNGTLHDRLHAIYERLGDEMLMFTDPADDGAHAQLRLLPEVTGIDNDSDRERLRPLAAVLLKQNARLLGIEDPDGLLALASG